MQTIVRYIVRRQLHAVGIALSAIVLTASPALAENGVSTNEILLGKTSSLSGPLSEIGVDATNASNAYFEHINQQGGVNGRKVRMITLDDQYNTAKGVANAKQLIEKEKVFALMNMAGAPTNKALLPIIAEAGIPSIAPYTGSDIVRTPHNRLIFNIRASYVDETAKIVEHLTVRGIDKIAVVYQNNDFGKEGLADVEKAIATQKLKVHAASSIESDASDVEKAAKALAASAPKAIVMITTGKASAEFIKAYNKLATGMQFFAVSVMGTQASVTSLGKDGIGVVVAQVAPFPFSATSGIVREYQRVMKAAGIKNLSFASMEGFITAKVVVEGLKRTGKDVTRERFMSTLESMGKVDFDGYQINFSKDNHEGSHYVDLTVISKDGRFLR